MNVENKQGDMNEKEIGLEYAEKYIKENNFSKAYDVLEKILDKDPNYAKACLDMGILLLEKKDPKAALEYLLRAEKNGYASVEVSLNIAIANEQLGNYKKAENTYTALMHSLEEPEKWFVTNVLTNMYLNHHMLLKAEKMAKLMMKDYPENYQGYRQYVKSLVARKQYERAEQWLSEKRTYFCDLPQYFMDYIEILCLLGKEDEVLDLIEKDDKVQEVIPMYALKKKVQIYSKKEEYDRAISALETLANEYDDIDAIQGIMILNYERKQYKAAGKIARDIIQREKENKGIRFFIAVVFQIYILYYGTDKRPDEEIKKWMRKAIKWCLDWLNGWEEVESAKGALIELSREIDE